MPWKATFSGEQSVSSEKSVVGLVIVVERQKGVPALSCSSGKGESDGTGTAQ